MTRSIFSLILISILLSACCSHFQSKETMLIGKWQLIEMLADPGDGSGKFSPVKSDKTITFKKDGVITSNGDLCVMSTDADNMTSGTYSTDDNTYILSTCNDPSYKYRFEIKDGFLVVFYPCIEPCQAKFKKVD